jgi:phage tail protein X
MTIHVRAYQYDTLDLLCWRHLGSTAGVVEAALELNRDRLSDVTLQHGQRVVLPDKPVQNIAPTDMVNLWD